MSDAEPAPQDSNDSTDSTESDEEAEVRRETEEARARAQQQIDEARRKGHEDA
jgi:hypothetical protein